MRDILNRTIAKIIDFASSLSFETVHFIKMLFVAGVADSVRERLSSILLSLIFRVFAVKLTLGFEGRSKGRSKGAKEHRSNGARC